MFGRRAAVSDDHGHTNPYRSPCGRPDNWFFYSFSSCQTVVAGAVAGSALIGGVSAVLGLLGPG